jgi:hypothetical protein
VLHTYVVPALPPAHSRPFITHRLIPYGLDSTVEKGCLVQNADDVTRVAQVKVGCGRRVLGGGKERDSNKDFGKRFRKKFSKLIIKFDAFFGYPSGSIDPTDLG